MFYVISVNDFCKYMTILNYRLAICLENLIGVKDCRKEMENVGVFKSDGKSSQAPPGS